MTPRRKPWVLVFLELSMQAVGCVVCTPPPQPLPPSFPPTSKSGLVTSAPPLHGFYKNHAHHHTPIFPKKRCIVWMTHISCTRQKCFPRSCIFFTVTSHHNLHLLPGERQVVQNWKEKSTFTIKTHYFCHALPLICYNIKTLWLYTTFNADIGHIFAYGKQ